MQWVHVLALMGDASDNVPGVPGVGAKGALSLIQQYGSVESVLENADKVKHPTSPPSQLAKKRGCCWSPQYSMLCLQHGGLTSMSACLASSKQCFDGMNGWRG